MSLVIVHKVPSSEEIHAYIRQVKTWFRLHPTATLMTVQMPWGSQMEVSKYDCIETVITRACQ